MHVIFPSQLLALLMLSNIGMMNTSSDDEQLLWPQMSVEMCEQLEKCSYQVKLMEALMKHMAKLADIKLSQQDGIYNLNMTKGSKNPALMCGSTRLPSSQDERQEYVHSEMKTSNESEANEGTQGISTKENLIQENKFEVPAKIRRRNCSVLSMAKSETYPNTIYLLLHCREMKKCPVNLHFVDLKSNKMLNDRIPFWDVGSRQNQIFAGPCVQENADNCLYMVTAKRVQLSITTNNEPATTTKSLELLTTHYLAGFRGKSLFCSVYNARARDLLCLSDGGNPYLMKLKSGSILVEKKRLYWHHDGFGCIKDFKTASITDEGNTTSYGVIVLNSSATLVSVNAEKKTIKAEDSIAMNAMTATFFTDGLIILHSKVLEHPFYSYKIDRLFRVWNRESN